MRGGGGGGGRQWAVRDCHAPASGCYNRALPLLFVCYLASASLLTPAEAPTTAHEWTGYMAKKHQIVLATGTATAAIMTQQHSPTP
jgi:hypothetical protein